MNTERLDATSPDGRRIAVWRSVDEQSTGGPVVVLSAGFGRRMRDIGSMALGMTRSGAIVYRFDLLNHLGLSDGEIIDFNITDMIASWATVIELARTIEGKRSVRLVMLSISALGAFRYAATDPDVDRIVAVSGVVHGARTLQEAAGFDYTEVDFVDLPPTVEIEGHIVDPRPMWRENRETGSLTIDSTAQALAAIDAPVINLIASGDPWVHIGDCETVFAGSSDRLILELPFDGHNLGQNPAAAKLMLEGVSKLAVGNSDLQRDLDAPIPMPGFDEILELRITERDRALAEQEMNRTAR